MVHDRLIIVMAHIYPTTTYTFMLWRKKNTFQQYILTKLYTRMHIAHRHSYVAHYVYPCISSLLTMQNHTCLSYNYIYSNLFEMHMQLKLFAHVSSNVISCMCLCITHFSGARNFYYFCAVANYQLNTKKKNKYTLR